MILDFKKLKNSFGFGAAGIKTIFMEEHAFRVMFLIATAVIAAMFYLGLPLTQKLLLFTVIVFILVLELLNSTIEKVLDFVCPGINGKVKLIKDMMAGIVLLACIGSAVIGILIFFPYFI
jgi:undecaprenol kinase